VKFVRPNVARKHKKILDELTENGGSMRQAILKVGYSQDIADTPQKITNSITWKQVLEKYFPDDILAEKHTELLEQKKIEYFVFPKSMDDEEIKEHVLSAGLTVIVIRETDKGKMAFYSIADAQAKSKALEMAYKIKGKYSDETAPKSQVGNVYNITFSAPVQERIREVEAEIKNMLVKKNDTKTEENLGTE
jgi:hypothetical protein